MARDGTLGVMPFSRLFTLFGLSKTSKTAVFCGFQAVFNFCTNYLQKPLVIQQCPDRRLPALSVAGPHSLFLYFFN